MTPKELLYIEDALGHTQFLIKQFNTAASELSDSTLKQQATRLAGDNQRLFDQFYNLV